MAEITVRFAGLGKLGIAVRDAIGHDGLELSLVDERLDEEITIGLNRDQANEVVNKLLEALNPSSGMMDTKPTDATFSKPKVELP